MINKRAVVALVIGAGLVASACGSSHSTTSNTTSPTTATPNSTSATTTAAPAAGLSATSFTRDFSAMSQLTALAAQGRGSVAVVLPDTVSSARYTEFDAPDLSKAFQQAGLTSSQYSIKNAQGSDSTQLTDAQSAITAGATVLIIDPLDSGVGTQIETYAKSHGVPVIDYDRLVLGGSRQYYVSFNNVKVGTLQGDGLATCITAWNVPKPQVVVMRGAATDNNATLFAQGYEAAMTPNFTSGAWVQVAQPAGTWDPPTAATEFEQAYTAHPNINAALIPNDENAAPIIKYLQTLHVPPKKFPTTGQDATLVGLQNVLAGYQCGTVYKPIYEEAQAAVALAMFLRAGKTVPPAIANGSTTDTVTHTQVPSVLLTPQWVTPANMNSTVIADNWVTKGELCAGTYSADCTAAGI